MQLRKVILFVLAVSGLILINSNLALAAPLDNELPLQTYDFHEDPFLLNWTFNVEHRDEVPVTKEEKLLVMWRKKQEALWNNLPEGQFTINASAYTASADECGKSDGVTASGLQVTENETLACPPNLPFGTKLNIEGVGERRCEDRGGAIKGNHIDIYVKTKTEAFAFGRKNLLAEVVK